MVEKQRTSGPGAQFGRNEASAFGAQNANDEDDFVTITGVTRVDDLVASIDLCQEADAAAAVAVSGGQRDTPAAAGGRGGPGGSGRGLPPGLGFPPGGRGRGLPGMPPPPPGGFPPPPGMHGGLPGSGLPPPWLQQGGPPGPPPLGPPPWMRPPGMGCPCPPGQGAPPPWMQQGLPGQHPQGAPPLFQGGPPPPWIQHGQPQGGLTPPWMRPPEMPGPPGMSGIDSLYLLVDGETASRWNQEQAHPAAAQVVQVLPAQAAAWGQAGPTPQQGQPNWNGQQWGQNQNRFFTPGAWAETMDVSQPVRLAAAATLTVTNICPACRISFASPPALSQHMRDKRDKVHQEYARLNPETSTHLRSDIESGAPPILVTRTSET